MVGRRVSNRVPRLTGRLRSFARGGLGQQNGVPPEKFAAFVEQLESLLSEQEEFLHSLQDSNDEGQPAGVTTTTPTTVDGDAAAAVGAASAGWATGGHQHALDTDGTPGAIVLASAQGAGPGVALADHTHGLTALTADEDILVRQSGALAKVAVGNEGDVLGVVSGAVAYAALSALALTGLNPTTPAQLTADADDYDLSAGHWARVSSDASRNVTGILAEPDGTWKLVTNVGANNVVLQHQNVGSAAANRILSDSGADITLAAEEAAFLIYDDTTDRWRAYAL